MKLWQIWSTAGSQKKASKNMDSRVRSGGGGQMRRDWMQWLRMFEVSGKRFAERLDSCFRKPVINMEI